MMRVCVLVFIGAVALSSLAFCDEQELTTEQPVSDNPEPALDRSSRQVTDPKHQGFWKKKFVFRPRWVKTWQEKKVYVAVWKHMWGPVEVKEWVPVPKPPPGWVKPDSGAYFIKFHH